MASKRSKLTIDPATEPAQGARDPEIQELLQEKARLHAVLEEKREKLRKLKMVKLYRSKVCKYGV